MLTRETMSRPRWPKAIAAFATTVVLIGAVVVAWVLAGGDGPVAAANAQVEVTFTGDATSYLGDREIIEGTVELKYVNSATTPAWLALHRYETGSDALAVELDFLLEGENGLPGERAPSADFQLLEWFAQGSHAVSVPLLPGTYLVDVGPDWDGPTHVYRAVVIEVVSD